MVVVLEVKNLRVPLPGAEADIRRAAAKQLRVRPEEIRELRLLKMALDARKKQDIHFCVTAGVSLENEKRFSGKMFPRVQSQAYTFPLAARTAEKRPVVCGAGPAGLFCALALAKAGLKPLLLEQGADAETRVEKIREFQKTGRLDERTNVQFGEGGAGTFSDGKLTTNLHDEKCRAVLEVFVSCGAPEEILYLAKPHLGTDRLPGIIRNLRRQITDAGGEVHFCAHLHDFSLQDGKLSGVFFREGEKDCFAETDRLVLATGHSARDVFLLLDRKGIAMERKPFSVGVRAEHLQKDINRAQWGSETLPGLGAADYKLVCHLPSGRSVYTFCMCPGGTVVAAASRQGELVVNGMSTYARDGQNANAALLVNVEPEDFPGQGVLAGLCLQEEIEQAAFAAGGGNYRAPAQTVGDFLAGRPSVGPGRVQPSYPLGVTWCSLEGVLPDYVTGALKEAIPVLGRYLTGFAGDDAVLTGVETRSSSPVRILRDERLMALPGLYPCGEGAGYAGGIMSAAVDGLRVAEAIRKELDA